MRKLATLMFVLAAAGAADAKPKAKGNVKVHMDKAAKAHKAGKFDVALTELPERAAAADRVMRGLSAVLADERGRWILSSHPESRCEYRLRVATPEGVRLMVIDRLTVDASGMRWIVDYKSSEHQGGELEAFLDNELERYRPQLARYLGALGNGS